MRQKRKKVRIMEDNYDKGMQKATGYGKEAAKTATKAAMKPAMTAAKKLAIKAAIAVGKASLIAAKALLVLLAPYIIPIALIFLLVFLGFAVVFGNPITQLLAGDSPDVLGIEEGRWAEEADKELWEEYLQLVELSDCFTESQKAQAQKHQLSAGILAGIDRMIFMGDVCPALFVPTPVEHFEALEPFFEWEDSDATVGVGVTFTVRTQIPQYNTVQAADEDGNPLRCDATGTPIMMRVFSHYDISYHEETTEGSSTRALKLLSSACTMEGIYRYTYERRVSLLKDTVTGELPPDAQHYVPGAVSKERMTLVCGANATPIKEAAITNARAKVALNEYQTITSYTVESGKFERDVIIAAGHDLNFERFLTYLETHDITDSLDVEGVLVLGGTYDPHFALKTEMHGLNMALRVAAGFMSYHEFEGFDEEMFLVFQNYAVFPVDKEHIVVSSPFGMRIHPTRGQWAMHNGIDLTGNGIHGKPVVSVLPGVVVFSGRSGGWGNMIIVNHGDFHTQYAHLDRIMPGVTNGKEVVAGEQIGTIGSTGFSTGPHLHFEIRPGGTGRINPHKYIFASRRL